MASLPTLNEQNRLRARTPVPIASSSRAATSSTGDQALGQGFASLGRSMANIAQKQFERQKRIDEMKAKNAITELNMNAVNEAVTKSGPDGSDMLAIYEAQELAGRNEALAGLDGDSAAVVEQYAESTRLSSSRYLMNQRIRRVEQFHTQEIEEDANQTSAQIQANPDSAALYAQRHLTDGYVNIPDLFTAPAAAQLMAAQKNQFANDIMRGYEAKGELSPVNYQKALALLDASAKKKVSEGTTVEMSPAEALKMGIISHEQARVMKKTGQKLSVDGQTLEVNQDKDPNVELLRELTAEQRGVWRNRFQNRIKQKAREDLSQLKSRHKDIEAAALSGADVEQEAIDHMHRVKNNAFLKPDQKVRLVADTQATLIAGEAAKVMRQSPRALMALQVQGADALIDQQIKKVTSDIRGLKFSKDKSFLAGVKEAASAKLMSEAQKIVREQNRDASQFVYTNFPEINQLKAAAADGDPSANDKLIQAVKEKQAYLGIPPKKRRVLTKAESAQLGSAFNSNLAQGNGPAAMAEIQEIYGTHFKEVMTDLIDDKSIEHKGIMVAAHLQDEQSRGRVLNLVQQGDEIKKQFKQQFESSDNTAVKLAVNEQLEEMQTALNNFSDSGAISSAKDFTDIVMNETRRLKLQRPDDDIGDLAEEAYKTIIEPNFTVVEGPNTKVLLPSVDANGRYINHTTVEAFISSHMDRDNFDDFDVAVPTAYKEATSGKGLLPEDKVKEAFFNELEREGVWKLNKSQTGLIFTMRGQAVKDNQGNAIEMPFSEMDGDILTIKARRGFLQKTKDFFFGSELDGGE